MSIGLKRSPGHTKMPAGGLACRLGRHRRPAARSLTPLGLMRLQRHYLGTPFQQLGKRLPWIHAVLPSQLYLENHALEMGIVPRIAASDTLVPAKLREGLVFSQEIKRCISNKIQIKL